MKFREYVGEGKVKSVKKIVQTSIGPTEEDFLNNVLREKPDGTKIRKSSKQMYLNFGLSKHRLKRVFDYIKSWFIRYHVNYTPINPYITLFVLDNVPKTSRFLNEIKKTKNEAIYKPMGTITVDKGLKKDYILFDYWNNKYNRVLYDIFIDNDIEVISEEPYVKLFQIESGIFNNRIYEDMMYSCPKIPDLKLGNISLKGVK